MNNSKHALQKVVSLHCKRISQPYTLEEICEQVMGEEYNAELMLQHLLLWCATNERDNDGDGSVEQNLDTAHAALVEARKLAALSKMGNYDKIGDAIKCVEGAFDMQPEASEYQAAMTETQNDTSAEVLWSELFNAIKSLEMAAREKGLQCLTNTGEATAYRFGWAHAIQEAVKVIEKIQNAEDRKTNCQ